MGRFEGGQWSEGVGKSTASDSFNNSIWDLSDLVILATVICRSRNKDRNKRGRLREGGGRFIVGFSATTSF